MTDRKRRTTAGSKATQFKKGQSGNYSGRPKKKAQLDRNDHPLVSITSKTYQGYKNGDPRELSAKELLHTQIYNHALKGRMKAIRTVFGWIKKRMSYQEARQTKVKEHCLEISVETLNPKTANHALRILGIIEVDESIVDPLRVRPQYFMQAWATQAALNRSRGAKLMSDEDLDWVLAYTHGAETLKLPRSYTNVR